MEAALMLKSAQPPSPHPACPEPSPKPAIASLQNKTKNKNLKHAKGYKMPNIANVLLLYVQGLARSLQPP